MLHNKMHTCVTTPACATTPVLLLGGFFEKRMLRSITLNPENICVSTLHDAAHLQLHYT